MKHQQSEEVIKKELISVRHNKNEFQRQNIRKSVSPSSRFLDNYFNSGMHQNAWKPNGKVIEKKKYNYGETGLSHFYSKNNVLQKLDIEQKEKMQSKKVEKHFLEYDYLEEGDVVITVEHCNNCEQHQTHTQHINDIYKTFSRILQKCIILRFPFIKVYLKPIETDIQEGKKTNLKSMIIEDKYKEVRIGAMEIQLAIKKEGKVEYSLLHSKLRSGAWPSINKVLNKIVNYLPFQNLNVKVYDKEEGLHEENEKLDELVFTKYENIKVNLYLLNNPLIKELTDTAASELETILDPKKRRIYLHERKQVEKEAYGSNASIFTGVRTGSPQGINTSRNESTLTRPFTGRSTYHSIYTNSIATSRIASANRLRPISTGTHFRNISGFTTANNRPLPEFIEDKEMLPNLKGMLIKETFTDKNGVVNFDNLPYDSYLVEIEDSKNFIGCAGTIKYLNLGNSSSSFANTQKFYGLRRQTHAYVEVYIYQENEDLNLQLITGSEVMLRRCTDGHTLDNTFFDDENKLILHENKKIKGRHEIVTSSGKYMVEVYKKGFDHVRKEIELTAGENKVNVELNKEKPFKIVFSVYDYQNKNPIENVNLKFSHSKSDVSGEGLTDSSGNYLLNTVNDDDFITVFAVKDGYIPVQRTFIKDQLPSKVSIGSKQNSENKNNLNSDDIQKDIHIFLVKEEFIIENKLFLIILYSNCVEDNFEPHFLMSDSTSSLVNIKTEDHQSSKGIISLQIEKKENFANCDFDKEEEYSEIIRLMLEIKNHILLKNYEIGYKSTFNGLHKYSCEGCLYAPNGNIFFIQSPQFSREKEYVFWDIGFLDIRFDFFYELGLLIRQPIEKNLFFSDWLHFLQTIVDKQIYVNIFETFQFNKGILSQGDRLMYEPAFIRTVKTIFCSVKGNTYELPVDFLIYLCDLMKNSFKMVSYSILKKKLASNLKNF